MMPKFKVYCNFNSALLVLRQIFKLPASIATIPGVAVTFYLLANDTNSYRSQKKPDLKKKVETQMQAVILAVERL